VVARTLAGRNRCARRRPRSNQHPAKPALQASARLRKNAAYFRINYLIVLLASVALGFLMHPSSLFVLGALLIGWVYVFAVRSGPLVINGRELRWGGRHGGGRDGGGWEPLAGLDRAAGAWLGAAGRRCLCFGGVSAGAAASNTCVRPPAPGWATEELEHSQSRRPLSVSGRR
jgi:hypothetical protein